MSNENATPEPTHPTAVPQQAPRPPKIPPSDRGMNEIAKGGATGFSKPNNPGEKK